MFAALKDKMVKLKNNLIQVEEKQPVSKAALVIIIFLDIFILFSIFYGLGEHTSQLTSPDEYVPWTCRQIIIDRDWNSVNRMDNLTDMITSYSTSYYVVEERKKDLHPVCRQYVEPIERIRKNAEMVGLFETRTKFQRELKNVEDDINELKGAYDTHLLESIARQSEGKAQIDKMKKKIGEKTAAMNTLSAQITAVEARINQNEQVVNLWKAIQSLQEKDRDRLKADLRTLNFWFPLKRLLMQMLFLIPLFVVFYSWNSASIRRQRGLQTLVSSHLLIVTFIPILVKIIEAAYEIIPKKILKRIIDLLISLKLVALWHYLVIAVSIAIALVLIYIFQRKLFSRDKMMEKRIAKGLCQNCGKKLPLVSPACPFCGFLQFKMCGHCNKPTHVFSKFCKECGKEVS